MSNPTIDEILLKPAHWRLDDYQKAKQALSQIVDEILGDDDYCCATPYGEPCPHRATATRNALRGEQRQRKAKVFEKRIMENKPQSVKEILSRLYSDGYDQQEEFYGEMAISEAIQALTKWVQAKKPASRYDGVGNQGIANASYNHAVHNYEQALLSDLDANQGSDADKEEG